MEGSLTKNETEFLFSHLHSVEDIYFKRFSNNYLRLFLSLAMDWKKKTNYVFRNIDRIEFGSNDSVPTYSFRSRNRAAAEETRQEKMRKHREFNWKGLKYSTIFPALKHVVAPFNLDHFSDCRLQSFSCHSLEPHILEDNNISAPPILETENLSLRSNRRSSQYILSKTKVNNRLEAGTLGLEIFPNNVPPNTTSFRFLSNLQAAISVREFKCVFDYPRGYQYPATDPNKYSEAKFESPIYLNLQRLHVTLRNILMNEQEMLDQLFFSTRLKDVRLEIRIGVDQRKRARNEIMNQTMKMIQTSVQQVHRLKDLQYLLVRTKNYRWFLCVNDFYVEYEIGEKRMEVGCYGIHSNDLITDPQEKKKIPKAHYVDFHKDMMSMCLKSSSQFLFMLDVGMARNFVILIPEEMKPFLDKRIKEEILGPVKDLKVCSVEKTDPFQIPSKMYRSIGDFNNRSGGARANRLRDLLDRLNRLKNEKKYPIECTKYLKCEYCLL